MINNGDILIHPKTLKIYEIIEILSEDNCWTYIKCNCLNSTSTMNPYLYTDIFVSELRPLTELEEILYL